MASARPRMLRRESLEFFVWDARTCSFGVHGRGVVRIRQVSERRPVECDWRPKGGVDPNAIAIDAQCSPDDALGGKPEFFQRHRLCEPVREMKPNASGRLLGAADGGYVFLLNVDQFRLCHVNPLDSTANEY